MATYLEIEQPVVPLLEARTAGGCAWRTAFASGRPHPAPMVQKRHRVRRKPPSTPESRAGHTRFMREWRRRRRAAELVKKTLAVRKSAILRIQRSTSHTCKVVLNAPVELVAARLRQFQQWYRGASPGQRWYRESPDLIRSLRLPQTCPAAWLAAIIAYWWMDDCARDAVGWLLTDDEPDWFLIQRLLRRARAASLHGAVGNTGPRFRRGAGPVPRGQCHQHFRSFLSVQRWHKLVVLENGLPELVLAVKKRHGPAKLKTSCAAGCLTAVRGIGPYLAKNIIATMLSHGLLEYDVGIVGPGSLATVCYLRGGSCALQSSGLLPNATDTNNARGTIAHLAQLEGCDWLDMQHALCLWRSSDSFAASSA